MEPEGSLQRSQGPVNGPQLKSEPSPHVHTPLILSYHRSLLLSGASPPPFHIFQVLLAFLISSMHALYAPST